MLAVLVGASGAHAQVQACAKVSSAIDAIAKRVPDLAKSGIKPRMAVVRIGTKAALALAYARDDGWSEEELAPLAAIRDLREPDESGQTIPSAEIPALLRTHVLTLGDVMHEKCPNTQIADVAALLPETE
ncbi:hypothetical protein U5922_005720 [Aquicoccus sp. G2-2]|uniref:hypothetical protein n=1 Tax=Aquicoccus sp. G2-2 TaxID=3092120 RepID=UPI002AE05E57|nr:hypothetical protein [Aquicoccus sp. G2-2]MEA1112992.1 hypothetical protein [Aquicoccus sp. G2-2]